MALFGHDSLTGASNAGGVWKKSRFSTNISLYLGNYTRYGHETPIGTHIRSIEGAISNDLEW